MKCFCRFHTILRSLRSMFPTGKMDSFSVVLFWQSQNSTETHCQLFWTAWHVLYFSSVEKTISSLCRMLIVKVTKYLIVF